MFVSRVPPRRSVVVIPIRAPPAAALSTTSTSFVGVSYNDFFYFNAERFRRLGLRVLSGYYSIEWSMMTSDATVPAEGYSVIRMPRSVEYAGMPNPVRSTTSTSFGSPGDPNHYSEVVELDADAVRAFNEGTRPTFGVDFYLRTTGASTAYIYIYSIFLVLEVEIG
jgi:hypothetical protein